jgi:hypothetical protein
VFDVSREAAEVRLLQRGHLIPLSSGLVCGDALMPGVSWNISLSIFQYLWTNKDGSSLIERSCEDSTGQGSELVDNMNPR